MRKRAGKSKKNAEENGVTCQFKKPKDGVSSDVLGSYTGMSEDGGTPEQDADDL
jgi:hypothetical protein